MTSLPQDRAVKIDSASPEGAYVQLAGLQRQRILDLAVGTVRRAIDVLARERLVQGCQAAEPS